MMLSISERLQIRENRAISNLWLLYLNLPFGFFDEDKVIAGKLYSADPEE
jgi:hypothetical protein